MPSPGKRTFAEFTQEYAKTFPPSPPRFVGGWPEGGFTGVAAKRQKYQKDIEEAYKVATRHPDVDPTRYMPGAFPDGVLLPEMLEVPQIIAWSSVKLNQGANTAKNTYIKARNAYQKSRRAAAAARDVVIGVVGAMGTVKRQAVQVYTGLSNLQIVRRASRPPSSRVASPNRRQRSPRPSPSSSPSSLSGAGEPEPMQLDVEPSSHQVIETPLDASATGPSDGPSTDQAVEDSPPSSAGSSIDTSTLDVDETTSLHSSAGPSDSSSVHLSSETSSPISVAEPSNAASTHPATMIGSLISALTKPLELLHVLKANKKQKGGRKAKSASKAVGKKSHNHSGSFFTPKVAPGNKVAKPESNKGTTPCNVPKFKLVTFRRTATNAAINPPMVLPLPAVVPPPFVFPPPSALEDLLDIADSFENEIEEDEELTIPLEPVDELETPSADQAVEPQTASSPLATYNGHLDVSMQEASSLLDEVSAPPTRHVHWHQSPRTGGPVSNTRVMTPSQSSPFALIANYYDNSSVQENEAGPSNVRPDNVEDEIVNEPNAALPVSQNLTATNVESLPVVVESAITTEPEHVVDAPLSGPSSVESVQETLSVLAVSQATQDARKAAAAAKRAKKQAEAKALAEEEARRKKQEEDAEISRLSLRFPTKPIITPLSRKWEEKVDAALRKQDGAEVTQLRSGDRPLVRDFASVCPRPNHREDGIGYLNDVMIEAYLQQVSDYGNGIADKMDIGRRHEVPRVQHMSTYFYSNIRDKGVDAVAKWTKGKKIVGRKLLECERLFIPVHEGLHWTLLVLSPKARTIQYYDSLGGSGRSQIANIKKWLKFEMRDDYIPSEWKVIPAKSSRQQNGIDCGVFAVTNAKMIALGVDPLAFKGQDATLQRRRMLAELLNGGFHGDFEPDVTFA